jgi:hypothetical protein
MGFQIRGGEADRRASDDDFLAAALPGAQPGPGIPPDAASGLPQSCRLCLFSRYPSPRPNSRKDVVSSS